MGSVRGERSLEKVKVRFPANRTYTLMKSKNTLRTHDFCLDNGVSLSVLGCLLKRIDAEKNSGETIILVN